MADPYAAFSDPTAVAGVDSTVAPVAVTAPSTKGDAVVSAGGDTAQDPWQQFSDAYNPTAPSAAGNGDETLGFVSHMNHAFQRMNAVNPVRMGLNAVFPGQFQANPTADTGVNAYLSQAKAQGKTPGLFGGIAGDALGSAPAMIAPGGPLAQGAISGLITGDSTTPGGAALDAGSGALAGLLGGKVAKGLGAAIAPRINPAARALSDAGVPLTIGQLAGGGLKRVEDAMTSTPILGDAIRSAQRRSYEGFNRQAINSALEPLGQSLPADINVGRDAIDHASDLVDQAYDGVAKGRVIPIDPQFASEAAAIKARVATLPKSFQSRYDQIVKDQIGRRIGPGGTMTDDGFKDAKTALNQAIRDYSGDSHPDSVDFRSSLQDLKTSLLGNLGRSAPDAADQLAKADLAFSRLATLQDASGSLGASHGMFTPAQMLNAVKKSDLSSRKSAFARGMAPMQQMADHAKEVLPSSVPDSGTALRYMLSELPILVGVGTESHVVPGGAFGMAAGLGGLLGSVYTKPGQAATQFAMTQRPSWAPAVRGLLDRYGAPPAAAMGGLLGAQGAQAASPYFSAQAGQ